MCKEKVKLPENHRRSLTSALLTVEQMLFDLEAVMVSQPEGCCYEVKKDLNDETIHRNLEAIREARAVLCTIAAKYETVKYSQSLRRIINAKKSRIWEILMDMKPKKQKGFGEFPKDLAKVYDNDIETLLKITEKIRSDS